MMLPVVVCAIILPLTLTRLYTSFSRRTAPFLRPIADTPRGLNVPVVVRGIMRGPGPGGLCGDQATSGTVYWHLPPVPLAPHGGFEPYLFAQGIPITPNAPRKAPAWAHTDSFGLRRAPVFDYYFVR